MNKNKIVTLRITEEEDKVLTKKAFESNMKKSEYIKNRIFNDFDSNNIKLQENQKFLISSSFKAFCMIRDLIEEKNIFTPSQLKKISKDADKFLV
ncbi:hypothetical protein N9X24_01290, partial [Rickettsiales bacterium]|nr:hypothetical protein [Rickettsiales bacterium]